MAFDSGVKISFAVNEPLGAEALLPLCTEDDAWYEARYRYEKRGPQWWAVLVSVEEIMPALTPQANLLVCGEAARLHMMHPDGSYDFTAEAEQRRIEWLAVNAAEEVS